MPKSPLDAIAVLVLLASFFLGSLLLKAASRERTSAQKAALEQKGFDPVVIGTSLGMFVAYFYAPLYSAIALGAAVALAALSMFRLVHLHNMGQGYTLKRRWFLMSGIGLQTIGLVVAVGMRAMA